jgi:hypothetical protein
MLGLGAELGRDQGRSPRAQAVADVIARDDEIGTVICGAAYHGIQTRLSVFQWAIPTRLVPRSLSIWRRGDEVAGEGLEVTHLGGILRRDDEAK